MNIYLNHCRGEAILSCQGISYRALEDTVEKKCPCKNYECCNSMKIRDRQDIVLCVQNLEYL